jgi:hypothetical protein
LCTDPFHGRRNIFDFLTLGKQPKKLYPAKALEAKEEKEKNFIHIIKRCLFDITVLACQVRHLAT